MGWDLRVPGASPEGRPATGSLSETDASMREALESVLHGTEADADEVDAGTPVGPGDLVRTDDTPLEAASGAPAPPGSPGAWETLVRFEEARWLRYGHPCVAVQLEIVGGADVTSHLGDEAGARVRAALDRLLATSTRASDRYEPRQAWRFVALLPETEEAGATVALERLQRAFADAMGPALAVRLGFGLAAPAPTGTLSVAFHQAGLALGSRHRRDQATGVATGDPARRADEADLSSRLDALSRLRDAGLVTDDEYATKRVEILDRL